MASNSKQYYSQRLTGFSVDHDLLKQILVDLVSELDSSGYFDEWFGEQDYSGFRYGGRVSNPSSYVLRKLRADLWPIHSNIDKYSVENTLTMIEFIFDHISIKTDDPFSDGFDKSTPQKYLCEEINPVLNDFGTGYVLRPTGIVEPIQPEGLDRLLQVGVPQPESVKPELIIEIAKTVDVFRKRSSNLEDRKNAIVSLAGIFEDLKTSELLSQVLNNKDENAIFEFANNFAIRHRNPKQITNYDQDIWLSWAFHYYLATIHAVLRLIIRQEKSSKPGDGDILQFIEEVKRVDPSVYSLLRVATITKSKDEVSLNYIFPFHYKRASNQRVVDVLNRVAKEVFGVGASVIISNHRAA